MPVSNGRVVLASLLVLIGAIAAPLTARAQRAGPTPSPTPTPTPTSTTTPSDQPSESPSPSPSESREPSAESPSPTAAPEPTTKATPAPGAKLPPPLTASKYPSGPFDTSALVALAARLRSFGLGESYVRHHAFAPFIVEGRAHWTNDWGALRRDPDGTWRRHLGDDVFCERGAPVLAAERGRLEFATDSLGGRVARLHRDAGGYFYYAHLSGWNTEVLDSGDRVSPGDVIGFCGNSGNAVGGATHVHFGYYSGGARDPMGFLITWLRRAETRARAALDELRAGADVSRLEHLFGDDFAPDLSQGSQPETEPLEMFLEPLEDEV